MVNFLLHSLLPIDPGGVSFFFTASFVFHATYAFHVNRSSSLSPSIVVYGNVRNSTYLVEVDHGLPELLVGLVEVPHTNLTEITGVVLVEVGTVVVLTTGHTTTTGVLAVLADTTVTGGYMTAAIRERDASQLRLVPFFDNFDIGAGISLSHFTTTNKNVRPP